MRRTEHVVTWKYNAYPSFSLVLQNSLPPRNPRTGHMADLLSVISGITGLLAIGGKIYLQLDQFIGAVQSAPEDIKDLAREIRDFCSILERVEHTFKMGVQHDGLMSDLGAVLESCLSKFVMLQELVQLYAVNPDDSKVSQTLKGWRWALQERQIAALRDQLGAHKMTLNITLLLCLQ